MHRGTKGVRSEFIKTHYSKELIKITKENKMKCSLYALPDTQESRPLLSTSPWIITIILSIPLL